MKLGVNIDHIAVLREARRVADPDPLEALAICKRAGADQITIHLREDRRHIQDNDAKSIISLSYLPVNLECATSDAMITIASLLRPHRVTFVPENRQEVTTEGGLDLTTRRPQLEYAINKVQSKEIEASLFIDPHFDTVDIASSLGVEWVEFHTGKYANLYAMLYGNLAKTPHSVSELELSRKELSEKLHEELELLTDVANYAKCKGLRIAMGHGLNLQNVRDIANIASVEELNIGQSIIANSIFVGLDKAIRDMKEAIKI